MKDSSLTLFSDFMGFIEIYNTKIKEYKSTIFSLKKYSFDTFLGVNYVNRHNGSLSQEELDKKLKKRIKERREKILDLALNNDHWEYFITLTFDRSKMKNGVYTHDEAISLLTKWINNQKHKNPRMSYLLVSEFQTSGQLHFHGLVARVEKWKLSPARYSNGNRKVVCGHQIYDLEDYKLGFVEVSEIESQERVSHYISKYITKELVSIPNKKTFWYSRDLERPIVKKVYIDTNLKEYYNNIEFEYYDIFGRENCEIEVAQFRKQHNLYYRKLDIYIIR